LVKTDYLNVVLVQLTKSIRKPATANSKILAQI